MQPSKPRYYLLNCFLLMIPVLVWNIALTNKLPALYQPATFQKDIPAWLSWSENISRTLLFVLTLCMPLSVSSKRQKTGMGIYISGLLLYFASWILLIRYPGSVWSQSFAGSAAPAYTPLCWLAGIALTGNTFYFKIPFRRWLFPLTALCFLIFHNLHTAMIFYREQ